MNKTIKFLTTLLLLAVSVGAWAETTYKLTQVTSVEAGGLYVFEQDGYVMSNTCSNNALQTTNTYKTTGLTGEETYVWTLETATKGFYMKNVRNGENENYLYNGSSTNVSLSGNKSDWKFSFQNDETVLIQNTDNSNRFLGYTNSTSHAYKAYATSNLSSYPHAIKVYKLEEEIGGSSGLTESDFELTDAPVALSFDLYNNSDAQTISYTTSSTGVVTVSGGEGYVTTSVDTTNKTITVSPIAVTPSAQTITINQAANETYAAGSATFTVTVTNSDPDVPGTENNPYTVADAITYINTLGTSTSPNEVYVSGIISQVDSYNSSYHSITYWISDDGSTTAQMEVYSGKGLNGADFSSIDDLKVGDIVTVKGYVKKYYSTPEFTQNNQLVSLEHPTYPIINTNNVTLAYNATSGSIAYTIDNPIDGVNLSATTDANWISNIAVGESSVTFTTTTNEGNEDRTATFTLSYEGATDKIVTVTQKHHVVDYATLPFSWEGGASADFDALVGTTLNGNGSDYGENNAPYLIKLDGTGDYIQVKTDSQPGKVTINVKMIGGATTSKITVQGSADGETFTDVEELEISGAQNDVLTLKTTNTFAATDRYVRLLFTKGSNVGVGSITIAKYSNDPVITVEPSTVSVDAAEHNGTIALSYENLEITSMTDFGIQYCDAEGNEVADEPDWIEVLVAQEQDDSYVVSYSMVENEGAARTAYFKVYAMGDENFVYSNLVTITQAAYVAPFEPATFTLAHSVTPGKEYIIVGEESVGEAYAMGAQNNNNRAAVKVDVENNIIEVASSDVRVFVIADAGDKKYTIYDAVEGGYLYAASSSSNHLKTKSELDDNGKWTIEFDEDGVPTIEAQGANTRNLMRYNATNTLFSCYGSGQNDVYLYEKVEEPPINNIVITSAKWATYVPNQAVTIPEGVTAYIVTNATSTSVSLSSVASAPANTGLVVNGEAGTYTPTAAETTDDVAANKLVVSDGNVTGDGATIYALGKKGENDTVGFKRVANNVPVPAGKPYLTITNGSKDFFDFSFDEGEATGIESIECIGFDMNAPVYDLQGRQVNRLYKGIFIQNGKKIIVK